MNVHILSSVTCSDNFLVRPNPNSQKAFLIHSFNHQLKTINLFVSPSCSIWEFEESVTCFFFLCASSSSGFLKKLTIDLKSTLNFFYLRVLRFVFFSLTHIIFVFLCFVFLLFSVNYCSIFHLNCYMFTDGIRKNALLWIDLYKKNSY